jgi:putative dimethyl sulfoxide reductase chaperone
MQITEVMVFGSQRGAAARSEFYRLSSALFSFPGKPCPMVAHVRASAAALRPAVAALPHGADVQANLSHLVDGLEAWTALDEATQRTLDSTYTALFDNCRGRATASLYEKDYGNGDAKMVWEELIRFYEHFGLDFDVGRSHDWPDHIGVELEFMHYLTFLEAAAPETDRHTYFKAQKDFLGRRLARWAHRFATQVSSARQHAPYGLYASIVQTFIDAEMLHLGCPLERTEQWVPLQPRRADAGSRTVIPIADISNVQNLPH